MFDTCKADEPPQYYDVYTVIIDWDSEHFNLKISEFLQYIGLDHISVLLHVFQENIQS